jgi:hypothetical protein
MKQLERYVKYINNFSKKNYILEGAYGKVRIYVCTNGKDTREGVSSITPFLSKGELNVVINSILNFIMAENNTYCKDKGGD